MPGNLRPDGDPGPTSDRWTGRAGMVGIRPAPHAVAVALLAAHEESLGVPAVDEDEVRRLEGLPPFRGDDRSWRPWLVEGPAGDGYLGLRWPSARDGGPDGAVPVVELSPGTRDPEDPSALLAGVRAAEELAGGPVHVWVRAVHPAELAAVMRAGATVVRTMQVLERALTGLAPPAPVPVGLAIRPWRPGDDPGVLTVLAAAHPASPATWGPEGLARRRSARWARPDDVLVAVDGDRVVGVHWTKRRDDRTGEVHNLALHPDAQGIGLGRALLDAGLTRLADLGLTRVLLWVDAANAPAVALYTSRGFTERCRDVLLGVGGAGASEGDGHAPPRGPRSPGGTSL